MSAGLPGHGTGLSLGVRLFHAVRLWLGSVLSPADDPLGWVAGGGRPAADRLRCPARHQPVSRTA